MSLRRGCDHPRAAPGLILVPQTFGEKLNPNPHCHLLATTQNVDPETGGYFETRLPSFWWLRMGWQAVALRHLEWAGLLTRKQALAIRARHPKGFHIHVSTPGAAAERQWGKEREPRAAVLASVGRYLVRTPLTESRVADYDREQQKVVVRYRGYEFDAAGLLRKKLTPEFEELEPLELLARLSVHIPLPRRHHVRYYGAYATRFRGKLCALGIVPRPEAEGRLRKECRVAWARLIKHTCTRWWCAPVGGVVAGMGSRRGAVGEPEH